MESLRRFNPGNKGGGGGGGRKLESGGGGDPRRLTRRNATKNIHYEHTRTKRGLRSDSESSFDESESSHSREDPFVFDEYRVMGPSSVHEMNEVCRYLGLSGPDSLGITQEDWDANKFPSSHGGGDSLASQEDPTDFTFVISPPPSYLVTSPQNSFRGSIGGLNDTSSERASGNNRFNTSQLTDRNDIDAVDVGDYVEQHRERKQERVQDRHSHRFPVGWRTRSASLPTSQSRSLSPPQSNFMLAVTPSPLLGNRIFEYPDPVTHIQRARSQPVLPSDISLGSIAARIVGEEKVNSGSVVGSNNPFLEKSEVQDRSAADKRSADQVPGVTGQYVVIRRDGESSSRSSSCSDGSGEYSPNYSGREPRRSPEQRSFEKKQDIGRVTAVAPSSQGSLSRPPPISLLNLPSDAFSTHDLLDGLGPSDAAVDVVGKQNSDSDSEDDERHPEDISTEEVGFGGLDTDDESLEGSNGKPQDPEDGHSTLHSAVTSLDGKKATDERTAEDEDKDTVELRPSETESNVEQGSTDVEEKEGTEQKMLITKKRPVEELQDPSPRDDETGVRSLVTFPWNKGDLLGAGSFGTVYEAFDSNGSFFAVKEVSLIDTDKNSQQCISQLEQEIELLSRFKHDNIVQYLGSDKADGKLYIFLELVSKGSLASLCKKFRLSHSQIIAYTRQILKGLKYLHDMNIVHRDIKCANILVDVKGTCKLADFGLAKQISALDQLKSCKGSAYWMAPEVIDPKKTYWLPADIWSLGCSVLEMFTGNPPFGDQEWYRVLWKVGHGEAPPIPENLSDDAKDFIGQCLEINASKRPTATALLQHSFVNSSSTTTNSGHLNPQLVVNSLHTITEERTGDFTTKTSGTFRSALGDSPLSNGHSGH